MPRVKDVDTVAPDDQAKPDTSTPQSNPVKSKPSKTSASKTHEIPRSQINEFRAKIDEILGHTTNPFSSFLAHPKVFTFQERDDKEQILLVLRPHWFTNVGWIITSILMVLAPNLLAVVPLLKGVPFNYQFVIILFWYLITFIYAFEKFLSWYFNVFIVTDERIIDIDFNNLLVKKFSEAKINMIQDVTSQVVGLFPTVLNYGTIFVQTAAEVPEIEFENVPNPDKVLKVLQQLRQEEELEALEGRIR